MLAHQAEKLARVSTRQVGHRDELALLPQQPVRKGWDVTHVDAPADHAPAFSHRLQGRRHQLARRRKDDCGIQGFLRSNIRAAGPVGAKAAREGLADGIARSGEGMHPPALGRGHLHDQVRCRAEAVQPQALAGAGGLEATPADQAGAHQGCEAFGFRSRQLVR